MHAEAFNFVEGVLELLPRRECVVEFGGRNVNGTIRDLFDTAQYTTVDLIGGPDVDVVCDAAVYTPEQRPDTVVCCETLEHTPAGQAICRNAHRILRPGGVLVVTAAGPARPAHSAVDGGRLRRLEYYLNVDPAKLKSWLAPFAFSMVDNSDLRDVYALAVKGGEAVEETKLGIVMPVWLHAQPLMDLTLRAVAHLQTRHAATLYVVTTSLTICSADELEERLQAVASMPVKVLYLPNVPRSVADAWNDGCAQAIAEGATRLLVVANDTMLEPDAIDELVAFGDDQKASGLVDLWSGVSTKAGSAGYEVTEGPDFNCFMFRPELFDRIGWFDGGFRHAYAEDNDFHARIALSGGTARAVHAARFFHVGSATIKLDPSAAEHSRYWFEKNIGRFVEKWGRAPVDDEHSMKTLYYRRPWNDMSLPLSFCGR